METDLDSIDDLFAEVCPFCGKQKSEIWRSSNGYVMYEKCDCIEYSQAREKYDLISNQLREEKDSLMMMKSKLQHYGNLANKLLEESKLGRRFKERTFKTFNADTFKDALAKAYRYAENFDANDGEGIMFLGSVGTGKTHLAAAIANYVISEYGIPVRFVTSIELFSALRDFENNKNAIDKIKDIPLLIIDDLGKEKVTEWNREKLFEIINYRYENYLPIIITTNGNAREIEANIGEAAYSRLCEMCQGVAMEGKDYRRGA